jgi:peptidyl-tRNA hydrolase ICT1
MNLWTSGRLVRNYIRYYSDSSNLEKCRQWIASLKPDEIPRQLFEVSFARSSGPGGQNVNKLNTKACIKMSSEQWEAQKWIPGPVKEKLEASSTFGYLTKSRNLVIQSDKTRSRHDNLEDCFTKLCNSIKDCVHFDSEPKLDDIRKWEKIVVRSTAERLDKKNRQSLKKQSRRRNFDE